MSPGIHAAAVLTFVGLDRIGLGGGGWAGIWCLTVGTSAVAAVLIAVRALAGEPLARRAAPFLVLAPSAVWVGTSADGYFAAVAAWSLALLALAATRRTTHPAAAALASGLLLGLTCYLSYGLTLIALIAAAVLWLTRTVRPLPFLAAGVAAVTVAFTLAGFSWWEGYLLLVERYYQGAAAVRPYAYWVWGNLACTVLITGPATVAALRRTLAAAPTAMRGLRPSAGPLRDPMHAAGRPRAGRAARPARRRPLRDEQGGDRTDLAAVRRLAPGRLRPAARGPPPGVAHRPSHARTTPQPPSLHRLVTAFQKTGGEAQAR